MFQLSFVEQRLGKNFQANKIAGGEGTVRICEERSCLGENFRVPTYGGDQRRSGLPYRRRRSSILFADATPALGDLPLKTVPVQHRIPREEKLPPGFPQETLKLGLGLELGLRGRLGRWVGPLPGVVCHHDKIVPSGAAGVNPFLMGRTRNRQPFEGDDNRSPYSASTHPLAGTSVFPFKSTLTMNAPRRITAVTGERTAVAHSVRRRRAAL